MTVRPLFLTSLLVAAVLALLGLYAASLLPADTMLPVHWNAAGEADRFEPARQALLFAPACWSRSRWCSRLSRASNRCRTGWRRPLRP